MFLKPSKRIVEWSRKLAPHAYKQWVCWFFLIFFFLDSFVLIMPIDGLMVVTLVFVPKRLKTWFLYAVIGASLGYIVMIVLTISSFQDMIVSWVQDWGSLETYQNTIENIHTYGYIYLCLAAYTIVPQNISLVTSILADLNIYIVFVILVTSKIFKLWWMHKMAFHFIKGVKGVHKRWKKRKVSQNHTSG